MRNFDAGGGVRFVLDLRQHLERRAVSRAKRAEVPSVNGQDFRDVQPLGNRYDNCINKVNVRVVVFAENLGGAPVIFSGWHFENKIRFGQIFQECSDGFDSQISLK